MESGNVNRHRRYRRDQLSARYVRLRHHVELRVPDWQHDAPFRLEVQLCEPRHDEWDELLGERIEWGWDDDGTHRPQPPREPQLDYTWPALRRSLERCVPFNTVLPTAACPAAPALARTRATPTQLERRLIDHLAALQLPLEEALLDGSLVYEQILAGPAESTRRELSALWHLNEDVDHAVALLLFRPFWLRSPETWSPALGTSLVEHLLTCFPVASALLSGWHQERHALDLRTLAWTVALGQGASLRRLARLATTRELSGWVPLPKKFPAQLEQVPRGLPFPQICAYAELLRLGGGQVEYRRLISDASYRQDPLRLSPRARAFWSDALRWLRQHRDALTDTCAQMVLAWARHRNTEARRSRGPAHDWSALDLAQTLNEAHEYRNRWHRYPRRSAPWVPPARSWRARGWDWREEQPGETWAFEELASSAELLEEGIAMRHCVGSYASYCAAGHSAIFSVRLNGERVLTVELNPRTRRIAQVHGKCNRAPTSGEQSMVERWLAELVCSDTVRATARSVVLP